MGVNNKLEYLEDNTIRIKVWPLYRRDGFIINLIISGKIDLDAMETAIKVLTSKYKCMEIIDVGKGTVSLKVVFRADPEVAECIIDSNCVEKIVDELLIMYRIVRGNYVIVFEKRLESPVK